METIKRTSIIAWVVPLALLIFFFIGAQSAYAEESPFYPEGDYNMTVGDFGSVSFVSESLDVDVDSWESSNQNVVEITDKSAVEVFFWANGVGDSVISVTDMSGKEWSFTVHVSAPPFSIGTGLQTVYTEYEDEDNYYIGSDSPDNIIQSAVSSDSKVLTVWVDYGNIEVTPVGAGTATITAWDQYGQEATFTMTFSKKYIDEKNYSWFLEDSANSVFLKYGDTALFFSSDWPEFKGTTITATIGGKKYTASYKGEEDGEYKYVIKNIPIQKPGTKYTYSLKKGEAIRSGAGTIGYGNLKESAYPLIDDYVFTYTGKKITPGIVVEYYYNNNNGETHKYLKKGTDYTVSYANNLNVGEAAAKATGVGNYRNTTFEYFEIIPKGTKIKKVTKAKKAFTVKWKKQSAKMSKSRITGYQIAYSTKKNMDGAKIVTVKGFKKTSKKIKKLKAKKKYYVQVRTYMMIKGDKYCSKWSAKKTVKTK